MKPKVSTGYLTPQANKKKNVAKRLSDAEENPSEPGFNENMFSALMSCPEKKKMIMELLAANKDAIEKYKKKEAKTLANSPLGKLKNKKRACESPTALLRRRALEQMTSSPTSTNKSSSSRSELSRPSSSCSEASVGHSDSPVSFSKILDGVVAYVEIKNKDQDRSSGAKAILKSMGAKFREKFTSDVTHVIFKDGSFMTYQKAKLMKIHLVSILWVEFCRKTMKRQPEKQYPALKSGFQDNETSMICSQMQKEYEDIIRDEYKRSIMHGTPLPSTRSLINRRRTLMTPSVSNLSSSNTSSNTSFQTATDGVSSQELSDREVAAINGFHSETELAEQENLILNDLNCFSEVSGPMVNGSTVAKRNSISNCILKSVENVDSSNIKFTNINKSKSSRSSNIFHDKPVNDSDMELTLILDSNKTPKAKSSKCDIYSEKTPKLPPKKAAATALFDRRKTICNSLLFSDTSTTSLISTDKSKTVSSLLSSDKSTNISEDVSFAVPETVKKSKRSSSSLFDANESFEFGRNKAKSSKISRAELDKAASAMSELNLFADKDTSKLMSSLQVSSENKESKKAKSLTRRSSSMSKLWLSSEQKNIEKSPERSISMSGLRLSSEKSNKNKEHSKVSSTHVLLPKNDKITDLSSMSSLQLRVSSENKESKKANSLTRRSSSMSKLWLSSEQKNIEKSSERSISMSGLRLSSEKSNKNKEHSKVSSTDVLLPKNDKITDLSSMSSLQVSSDTNKQQKEKSSMSSLQVSAESRKSAGRKSNNKDNRNNTLDSDRSMSSLHVSSEKEPRQSSRQSKEKLSNNASFSSINEGSSGAFKNLVESVIKKLHTPDSATVRKKSDGRSASLKRASMNSDDSEILSPKKIIKRTMVRHSVRENNNLDDSSCTSDDNISKSKERELLSAVTKRRKTLGSRRRINTRTKTFQGDIPIDENKILVVNILKSPLNNNFQNNKDSLENKEPALLNTRSRRTLGKELKNTKSSKTSEKNSRSEPNKKSTNRKKQSNRDEKSEKNHQKITLNTSASELDMDSSNSKTKSGDSSDSTKSRKKLRKLYNPDDSIHVLVDDEQERKEKRLEFKKRKSNEGVFINPAEILKSSDKGRKNESSNESVELESTSEAETPPKRTRKGNKKDLKRASLNSSADEQKELLNDVINKKNKNKVTPKTPKSVTKNNPKDKGKTPKEQTPFKTPSRRKSTRITKPSQKLIDSQKSIANLNVAVTPVNRRSTLDFQPISSSKKPKKVEKMKLSTIVCTKLHKSDVQVFAQIVKKLGRFTVEDEVSSRTTHLVAGEPKRTINMLRAVSRGCWILKYEWVLQSLEAGKWLREEDFEIHDFSPVVQKCRLERQAFGPTYTLDVFETCPPIYIAPSTKPRCSDLKELITTCRGRVVTTPRMAKIIIGEYLDQEDTVCVNETWVLDCITFNKKIKFKKQYLLEKDTNGKRKSLVV